ncbi:putative pheophorbide a oxygenase [Helianthus anomalus]
MFVVWWDKNENEWKVFDDRCPHRLAPLSEGRIDQWGRLQCVYHGWCFGGSGDCKFIPQAPLDGPALDREGGEPIDIKIQKIEKNGFTAIEPQGRIWTFVSPCLVQGSLTIKETQTKGQIAQKPPRKQVFTFFCIHVSLGNSRFIGVGLRHFNLWIDPFVLRWMQHILTNLVLDSDLYLLRVQVKLSILDCNSN